MHGVLCGKHLELLSLMRLHVLALFPCYSPFFQTRGSVLVWLALGEISAVFPSCSSPGWTIVMVGWRGCFQIMQMDELSPFSVTLFLDHGGMTYISLYLILPYFSQARKGLLA